MQTAQPAIAHCNGAGAGRVTPEPNSSAQGQSLEHRAASRRAGALQAPQFQVSMACGPVHLQRLRNGDPDPRLVCAGRDAIGVHADDLCLHAACRHAAGPHVWRDGRQGWPAQAPVGDARALLSACRSHHVAGLHGKPAPLSGARHCRRDGHGAAIGQRHADRSHGRDSAEAI